MNMTGEGGAINFLDPIAQVWNMSSILGIAGMRKKKKVSCKAKKTKNRKPVIGK
ncbi:MAG: hypothetical protein WC412_07340 [Candidatus Omnitrophota bacterium]|jgi:hypothetical protein